MRNSTQYFNQIKHWHKHLFDDFFFFISNKICTHFDYNIHCKNEITCKRNLFGGIINFFMQVKCISIRLISHFVCHIWVLNVNIWKCIAHPTSLPLSLSISYKILYKICVSLHENRLNCVFFYFYSTNFTL